MARRQAGDGGRRDLLAGHASRSITRCTRPITPCGEGREGRRARREVRLRRAGQSRIAAASSGSSRCCRSIGGRAPTRRAASAMSPRPRSKCRSVPAPTRSRNSWPGRSIKLERVKDYWGATSPSQGRHATISTRCASSISATTTVALEAFKADQVDWIARRTREAVGDGLRLPGGGRQAGDHGGVRRSAIGRDAGLRASTSAATKFKDRAAAPGASTTRSTSRR